MAVSSEAANGDRRSAATADPRSGWASVSRLPCGLGERPAAGRTRMSALGEERPIRGASTSGLASEVPPGRPGNGWRGLSGLDSGSAASREQPRERKGICQLAASFDAFIVKDVLS